MKSRQKLIDENTPAVKMAVGAFLCSYPHVQHLAEDLESGATIGLLEAVDRYRKGRVKNLAAYLRLTLWRKMIDVVRLEDDIQSPRNVSVRRIPTLNDDHPAPMPDDGSTLGDKLRECCEDETDQLVVAMLRAGKTIPQIARELNLSARAVRTRKREIGKRLRR